MSEPISGGRDERRRRQLHQIASQRDYYRSRALDAVAVLLLRTGDDYDLLDADDLAAAHRRALELRAKMADGSR